MINRRSFKTYIIVAIAFSALLVLYSIPQTGIHEHTKAVIGKIAAGAHKVYGESKPDNAENNEADKDDAEQAGFSEGLWWFQMPMPEYQLPNFTKEELNAGPHNYKGPGQETIATFYATRDADMHDPYFLAAQQIVYRVLWDPRSRTDKYSMTVFVTPFVAQEQREYFTAAGALVRELPIHSFVPAQGGAAERLKDMFSKLEMWRQLEYSRIAYLDGDAFPIANIDEIFELAKWQMCKPELLPEVDRSVDLEICRYTFAGWKDFNGINAGVLVFNPSEPMYQRLIRESLNQTNFDNGFMEQALLQYTYDPKGPFPPSTLNQSWNAGPDLTRDGVKQYIVHHKLWATQYDDEKEWHKNVFNHTWQDMLDFYKSDEFKKAREAAGPMSNGQ